MGRLDGRVAVVTGAGRGIGAATALRLAQEGARVVVNDVDAEPAHETADAIREAGGEATVSLSDTVQLDAAKEMLQSTVDTYGQVDVLVNNAGITRDKTFHNMDDGLWDTVIDVNLKTAYHCCLAAMPHLREVAKAEIAASTAHPRYHRKITMTSSSVALTGNPGSEQLHGGQGRDHQPDQDPGPRARALPHQRQRGGPGLRRHPADAGEGGRRRARHPRGDAPGRDRDDRGRAGGDAGGPRERAPVPGEP